MHACVHNSTEAVFRLGHSSYKKIQISVFAFLGWMKDNYIWPEGEESGEERVMVVLDQTTEEKSWSAEAFTNCF